jgi:hypothetical protein
MRHVRPIANRMMERRRCRPNLGKRAVGRKQVLMTVGSWAEHRTGTNPSQGTAIAHALPANCCQLARVLGKWCRYFGAAGHVGRSPNRLAARRWPSRSRRRSWVRKRVGRHPDPPAQPDSIVLGNLRFPCVSPQATYAVAQTAIQTSAYNATNTIWSFDEARVTCGSCRCTHWLVWLCRLPGRRLSQPRRARSRARQGARPGSRPA